MTKVVNINSRGGLTLPRIMRRRLGVKSGGQVVVEECPEGVLLRPGATFPLEIYSDERLAEFERTNDEQLAPYRLTKRKK